MLEHGYCLDTWLFSRSTPSSSSLLPDFVYTKHPDPITLHTVAWCPNVDLCLFALAMYRLVSFCAVLLMHLWFRNHVVVLIAPHTLGDAATLSQTEDRVNQGFIARSQNSSPSSVATWHRPTSSQRDRGILALIQLDKVCRSLGCYIILFSHLLYRMSQVYTGIDMAIIW